MLKKVLVSTLVMSSLTSYAKKIDYNVEDFKLNIKSPHKVILLNSGLASFEQRLKMIEEAKTSIEVEYFIYNEDDSGKIFTQALIKKAKQGVKVKVLLDSFMIKGDITPFHVFEMEKSGIEVKYFNNLNLLLLTKALYRNHRKLLIVDDVKLITGGRNIGNEYFDMSEEFNFLDRELYLEGKIVKEVRDTFDVYWNNKNSKRETRPNIPKISDDRYNANKDSGFDELKYETDMKKWIKNKERAEKFTYEEINDVLLNVRAKGKIELEKSLKTVCNDVGFATELPILNFTNRKKRIIKNIINNKISTAKSEIVFDSPYFIVEKDSEAALNKALDNKVNIELLTNGLYSTDAIYVYDVFHDIVKDWIAKGLKTNTYNGEIQESYGVENSEVENSRFGIHAKSFVIDNLETIVGTYNFDPRSANLNSEMIVSCNDNSDLALEVKKDIHSRMKNSVSLENATLVEENAFNNVDSGKRFLYGVLKIPSHLFKDLL